MQYNVVYRLFSRIDLRERCHLRRPQVKALVLDLIHNMDVVEQLGNANAAALTDWQWRKQLRYYLTESGHVVMRMVASQFDYTYEYQGNAPKLVHTPLTDKCYLTLTQAMYMGYGGNPYGPAGTGKTESVKALGGAFGRQVAQPPLVFYTLRSNRCHHAVARPLSPALRRLGACV